MTAGVRLAAFAALLAAVFALATVAGRAVGPTPAATPRAADHMGAAPQHRAHATALSIAAPDTTLTAGRAERLTFTIRDAGGAPVRDFEIEQGRRMHLVVVRRDLRRFQHLHPVQDPATGAWSVPVTLPDAGVYHAFADFQPAGGERQALGVDLFAAGRFDPLALPAAADAAVTDGYDVALRDDGGRLSFTVGRGGMPISALQPYLGAFGHLVMLRAGDLAYEHAHPLGDRLAFDVGDAAPGTYRLFLQFRHGGAVHTAAFTHEVAP